jgi:starch phosphorylase
MCIRDRYLALARTVREYLMARWIETLRRRRDAQAKSVAYLSASWCPIPRAIASLR